jgi:RimJ/RimL family protein N-acetyltransferase
MRLRYVHEQDHPVARFVAALIPHVGWRGFSNYRAIGVIDDRGELIAGLVYTNWNPMAGTIELSAAAQPGRNWLTRATVRLAFDYAFEKHGCQMVIMRVRADNVSLLARLSDFGFSMSFVHRLYGRDTGGMVCTFTAEQWAQHPINRKVSRKETVTWQ